MSEDLVDLDLGRRQAEDAIAHDLQQFEPCVSLRLEHNSPFLGLSIVRVSASDRLHHLLKRGWQEALSLMYH